MTVAKPASIDNITHALTGLLRSEPAVLRLYGRKNDDLVELWLLTESIDLEREMSIYELAVQLDREFPGALIDFHLVNPVHFEPFQI